MLNMNKIRTYEKGELSFDDLPNTVHALNKSKFIRRIKSDGVEVKRINIGNVA